MKIFIAIYIWTVLLAGSLSITGPKEHSSGLVVEEKENLFVLKASRNFKGAEVEVISSSGYVITSRRLTKRKLIIDFKNVTQGTYQIQVKKAGKKEIFKFTRK
jgi:hypothetical protein